METCTTRNSFLTLLLLLSFLAGCTHTATSLQTDQYENLPQNEGFLVLALTNDSFLTDLRLTGKKSVRFTGNDTVGTNYLIANLPAGKYRIDRISQGSTYVAFGGKDEGLWDIHVKPGSLNYVGHLDVTTKGWIATMELVNKASLALEFLEEEFPNLLEKYRIQYSGPGEDDFFSVVGKSPDTSGEAL